MTPDPPPSSDLSITKTAPANALTGDQVAYQFTVANAPGSDPSSVTVTDQLPAGLTFVEGGGFSWDDCTANGQNVTCAHPTDLPAGDQDTNLAIVVNVGAAAAPNGTQAKVDNTATVSGPHADPNSANNSSSASFQVEPVTDLTMSKTHSGDFTVGFTGAWPITVHNLGPGVAGGTIVVEDTLPAGFEFAGVQGNANGWACNSNGSNKFSCLHGAPLGLGDSQFIASVAPLSQATPGGVPAQVTNTATISAGNELSGKTNNNTASDDATVNPSTDLQLSKSHSGNFTHGQHGTYTLIVTNAGAFDSAGPITVTDTLPTGWGYVASGSGDVDWTCPNTDVAPSPNVTPQVVCTHAGGLANGAQTSFPLIANVPSGIADNGPVILTNTATVAGPMPDSKGFNNSDPDDTKVVDSTPPSVTVPLDITKSNDPNLATAVVTYNASATDNTPGVTLACSPPSGTAFPLGTTTVTCTATDTSGNTDSKSFKVKVNDTQPPSVTVPLDIIQSNDPGKATAVVTYSATASDNAPGVTLSCVPPSGTAFQLGPTTVTCTATDSSANTAVKSFKVTVNDTEPPVVTVPANMTKNATSPSGAVVTFVVTATDNAPGVTKACVPPSGSTFAIGTTTVNCTATDGAGNTDTKSFQIKVLGAVDQLNNLVNLVKGMKIEPGFQSELLNRLNNALKALNQKSTAQACTELAKFVAGAKAKSGQKLSVADATTLISEANRIRQVLAC